MIGNTSRDSRLLAVGLGANGPRGAGGMPGAAGAIRSDLAESRARPSPVDLAGSLLPVDDQAGME